MSYLYFLWPIVVVILAFTLLKSKKVASLFLVASVLFYAFSIAQYTTRPDFTRYVRTYVSPIERHVCLDQAAPSVLVPPKTTMSYRFSETGAVYFTRMSPEEIINFYNEHYSVTETIKAFPLQIHDKDSTFELKSVSSSNMGNFFSIDQL